MKNYHKRIIVLIIIGCVTCIQAQEVKKSILEPCFKKYFFKKKTSFEAFEKALIKNNFIKDSKDTSYLNFFSTFFPYNKSIDKEFSKRKKILSKLIKHHFKKSDNLKICLSSVKKEKATNELIKFLEARRKIDKIIASAKPPKSWSNYSSISEVWKVYLKEDWFNNIDVKYVSIFTVYMELSDTSE